MEITCLFDIFLKDFLCKNRSYNLRWKSVSVEMKIDFIKDDAHTGNKYNEMADQLAKEALGL